MLHCIFVCCFREFIDDADVLIVLGVERIFENNCCEDLGPIVHCFGWIKYNRFRIKLRTRMCRTCNYCSFLGLDIREFSKYRKVFRLSHIDYFLQVI